MTRLRELFLVSAICLAPTAALADVIWVGESSRNPIMAGDVHIIDIRSNTLIYSIGSGEEATKPVDLVQQMSADGETDFNTAEQAYHDGKITAAAEGYQRTIRTTTKDWVRDRSSVRLLELATKLERFDLASTAYVALLVQEPATAAKNKPAVSETDAPLLDSAVSDINRTLASAQMTDSQRGALLGYALEIYRAKNDSAGVNQTAGELMKLGLARPEDVAIVKLASARLALDSRDYQKAKADIEQNRQLFVQPSQQADALFVLAQAKDGITAAHNDDESLKDLAIVYMRAVVAGRDAPGQPHVSEALFRIAGIEEQLKEPKTAMQLYHQIARDFGGQPIASRAKAASDRLARGT
jgi:TolA-binding protein